MKRVFIKKLSALILICVIAFSLGACAPKGGESETTAPAEPAKFTIGLIQSEAKQKSELIYKAFCRALSEKGGEEGKYYSVKVSQHSESKEECDKVAKELVECQVDLIIAIGENAAVAASKATKTIPVIFCSVYDPIESGLVKSSEKPGGNVTGVSDYTPVEQQFAFIRKVLPNAKNVTSIHHLTDANSILVTTLAKDAAKVHSFEYASYSASDTKRLEVVLADALEDTDALYLCEDELTVGNAEMIVKAANEAKVPIFASSDAFMSFGTFATCMPDYDDLGYNAGELALICLKELHPIGNISVEYPVKCIGYISQSVADMLKISVQDDDSLILLP